MAHHPDAIRSAWPLEGGEEARPFPLAASAWLHEDNVLDPEPCAARGPLAAVMRWSGGSFVVVPHAASATPVRLNGAPIPGGLAPLSHGDLLALGSGPRRRRWWLSVEGPCIPETIESPAVDALTLEEVSAGATVVRCGCGAVYALEAWESRRRCVLCDFVEDGVFRRLPPGWSAGRGTLREPVR